MVVGHADMRVAARLIARPWPVHGRILFVNGAISTMAALRWAESGLSRFEIVAFDYPMVGLSRALNPDLHSLDRVRETEILLRLIDRFQPDFLLSQSWGGAAALWALSERPPSIRRAIVSSFSFEVSAPLQRLCERLIEHAAAGRRREGAALAVREVGAGLPPRLQQAYVDYFYTLDDQQLDYVLRQMRDVTSLSGECHRARLGRIDVPVLFGNGALDRITPPESARPFAECVAGGAFRTVSGAAHLLVIESKAISAQVCAEIEDFFAADAAALSRIA
jgi:pimeloyl-ACP methyl ester carboxylesterase